MTKVAVGILRRDGKILACQRKRGGRYELKWEFPGGKVEPGESILQCLARELREELSIGIHSIDRMEILSSTYDDGGLYEVAYCSITGFDGEPKNNVFEELRWVTLQELRSLDNLEGNKDFISRMESWLKK